jgi:hypothetical protein
MSDEWGPWIEHDGGENPVGGGFFTQIETRSGYCRAPAGDLSEKWVWPWGWNGYAIHGGDILRYRIRKPRGLTILESLLADLPETVDA